MKRCRDVYMKTFGKYLGSKQDLTTSDLVHWVHRSTMGNTVKNWYKSGEFNLGCNEFELLMGYQKRCLVSIWIYKSEA